MIESMKVSIIVPVYNVAKYIERCLLSVLDQTWQDLEVILVNDCTPDNSMEIARRVVASHPRGTVVRCLEHEENRGLSAARNTGISASVGDYLYFLDSDDYISANAIELLADAAVQKRPDFVIGNYEVTGARRWAPPLSLGTGFYEGNALVLSTYVQGKWYVMAWNKLVSRPLVLQHKLYFQEGIVHEDDLWSFKLACMSQSMYVVNETTYYYSMQPDSIMRAPSMRNLECRVLVLGYIYDFIRSSRCLQDNRLIYIYFESLKAKYFDRILYFTKDTSFHYQSYLVFRNKKYASLLEMTGLRPEWKLMLQNMFQSFLIAAERPKFGLLITLAAGVTNMVLDALFVGVFRWGIAGAAIATGISQTVGGVVPLMYFLFSKSSPLRLRWTKFEVQPLLRSCANGSSELMSNISGSLIGMLYNAQLMRFLGEDGVATYGVLMYVQFIFVAIDIGYSIGCAPIISYHYGARNHPELRNLLTKGLKVMGILGIVMTIAAISLSGTLANIFVGYDATLCELTRHAFHLFSFAFLLAGFNIFLSSFFTALNNGGVSAAISFLRTLVFQAASVILLPMALDVDGLWWAASAAEALAFVVSIGFLLALKGKYHYFDET